MTPRRMLARLLRTRGGERRRSGRGDVGGLVPDAIEAHSRRLVVGDDQVATLAICGYPREVYPGWLHPLLTYPGRLDVSVHVEPIHPTTAAAGLNKRLARLESSRRQTHDHGRLPDPEAEVATEDAYYLSARIARGDGRLFRIGVYLSVHADTEEELADEVAAVRALAASLLFDARPTTWRSLQGWVTCLPVGLDLLRMRRSVDTAALAAAFPFASADLPPADPATAGQASGVLYGYNVGSQGLVCWDRFAQDNHNSVILARSGAGKSYLAKLEALRSLYRGVEVLVIDPEDEYARLCDAVGGTHVPLGADRARLNPFDLPIHATPDGRGAAPRDALIRRTLFLHTAVSVLLGEPLTPAERAVLDVSVTATYRSAGITSDPRTWHRPPPTLTDLAAQLADHPDAVARALATRLHPYVEGSFAGMVNGSTTVRPEGHLVVFSLREVPDELKPTATLLTLDRIWDRVSNPVDRRPRLVLVDEAWLLLQNPAGAQFLFRAAKALRKHWAGLTVATQDVADVLATDLGKAVVSNAATQILLRQAPQAIDQIAATFDLSDGERDYLLSADQGQGLLSAGAHRVAFQTIASDAEHRLVTSDPAELTADDGEIADSDDGYVHIEPSEVDDDAA